MVSMIQPRMIFRVAQLPSPFMSFLRETASFLWASEPGWASTWSIASNRQYRSLCIRFLPPWPIWMKSSTKTSVEPTGLKKGMLEGGTGLGGCWGSVGTPGISWSTLFACSSSSGMSLGSMDVDRSSNFEAMSSSLCGDSGCRPERMAWLARSQVVSDMVLKVGGDWVQPMVQASGMAISCSSFSYLGRTTARRRHPWGSKNIR